MILFFANQGDILQLSSYKQCINQQSATWILTFLNMLENVMSYVYYLPAGD